MANFTPQDKERIWQLFADYKRLFPYSLDKVAAENSINAYLTLKESIKEYERRENQQAD